MGVFVIAEAGVNHNGALDRALAMVDAAAAAGADAVKFQSFHAEDVVTAAARKAPYQLRQTGGANSQFAMLKALELDESAQRALWTRCRQRGIVFLSSPFDLRSLDFLVDDLGVTRLKIASGEITHAALLIAAARSSLPIILSTGMSTIEEVAAALGIMAAASGLTLPDTPAAAAALGHDAASRHLLAERVTLLHCTSEYPAPVAEANLRAMDTLAQTFGLPVGLSDHTPGITVAIAAAARGAAVIEKHFTLDRSLPGPDHAASLDIEELARMVAAVREVEAALGSSVKEPTPSEQGTRAVARRSLVAARDIAAGERFTNANLCAKRPGDGLSPLYLARLVGRPARRAYAADAAIAEDEIA